jgi:adenylate cyclase
MTEPAKAVFLSYASQDAEAAKRICEALRAGGIEVWFDQSELRGGDAWDRQIRKQIHDCALFIPVISTTTQRRAEGYFRLEWKLAVERTQLMSERIAFLVPVVVDDTGDAQADVPDAFRAVQWTRLPGGETSPAFMARVAQLLSQNEPQVAVQARRSTGSASAFRSPTPTAAVSRRSILVPLVIGAVALLGVSYFVLDRFVLSKRSAGSLSALSAIPEKSIAVLPFVDLSEKKDQEYFADGMAEEILNLLVKVPELKVIGRTSSFQFKGKTDDLRKIGTALGATYVVEGSVRRSGDRIRVTAQLIDSRDGTHRWSDTYDRGANDALKVQDEIAMSLVRALQLEVTPFSHSQGQALVRNGEAYDAYLRGLHALNRYDQGGFEEAVANFRQALELDPSFAPAGGALALALRDLVDYGFVPQQTGWDQARVAAEAALKLDANSAIAHAVLGNVYTEFEWDWRAAARELKTAVALAPNYPPVLGFAAMERLAVGQWDEALHFLDAATTADPLDPTIYVYKTWTYVRMGRLAEAERAARRPLEIDPTMAWGHYYLGNVLLMRGRPQEALPEMQSETHVGAQQQGLAVVYQTLGQTTEADAAQARLTIESAALWPMGIAEAYAFRGQKDRALDWLDKAYTRKDAGLWSIMGDPLLKNLEGDPRYKAFLRKMNLPH